MYQQFLNICSDIITIGGAISIILSIFVLFSMIGLMKKLNIFLEEVNEHYEFVKNVVSLPFTFISKFFK